jgi:hypothetical protein
LSVDDKRVVRTPSKLNNLFQEDLSIVEQNTSELEDKHKLKKTRKKSKDKALTRLQSKSRKKGKQKKRNSFNRASSYKSLPLESEKLFELTRESPKPSISEKLVEHKRNSRKNFGSRKHSNPPLDNFFDELGS